MGKSTRKRSSRRPQKPYEGFPLFPHATGRWAKKIRQRMHYFGKIASDLEGKAALEKFNREWPYLKESRTPPPIEGENGCRVVDLVNQFLNAKSAAVDDGELSERAFTDYYRVCEWLLLALGKDRRVDDLRPEDFAQMRSSIAKGRGPVTIRDDRNGRGFYTLRHVFETIGGESKDQVAVNAIMGHVDNSMAGVYRERISDERLREVTDTVRRWLFGGKVGRKASA